MIDLRKMMVVEIRMLNGFWVTWEGHDVEWLYTKRYWYDKYRL